MNNENPKFKLEDEDLAKQVEDYINGFRKVLEDITKDELLKNPAIVLDKFDEYFS